jgi:hypothetical protein
MDATLMRPWTSFPAVDSGLQKTGMTGWEPEYIFGKTALTGPANGQASGLAVQVQYCELQLT